MKAKTERKIEIAMFVVCGVALLYWVHHFIVFLLS